MTAARKRNPQPTPDPQDTATQAFLREVDEALHEDKMKALWQQWRMPIGIAVATLFVVVGGYEYITTSQEKTRQQAVDSWYGIVAAEGEDAAKAAQLATMAQETHVKGVKVLAAFQSARLAAENGEAEKAAEQYQSIATDSAMPQQFRDLAQLYSGIALMSSNPQQAETYLSTLDVEGNAFRGSALEMMAEIAENKQDVITALALWEKLQILPNVPDQLRDRARGRTSALKTASGL